MKIKEFQERWPGFEINIHAPTGESTGVTVVSDGRVSSTSIGVKGIWRSTEWVLGVIDAALSMTEATTTTGCINTTTINKEVAV